MGTSYDAWLTTDRAAEDSDQLYDAFVKSDAYMDAYTDYCETFESSSTFDRAFEQWASKVQGEEADDYDEPDDGFDPDVEFYGLHYDEGYDHIDAYGDTQ